MHTLPCVKQIASGKLLGSTRSSAQCCDGQEGWDGGGGVGGRSQRGGGICRHIADSLHCTAETNTALKAIILQEENRKNMLYKKNYIVHLWFFCQHGKLEATVSDFTLQFQSRQGNSLSKLQSNLMIIFKSMNVVQMPCVCMGRA